MSKFLPADLIFAHGSGLFRLFQTSPGEPTTWAGHVAGFGTPTEIVEALWHVRCKPWSEWAAHEQQYEVWRHTGLSFDERLGVADKALWFTNHTVHYGWWKLGVHLGDWGLAWARHGLVEGLTLGHHGWEGEAYVLRRLMFLDEFPICNWVWAKAYQEAIDYRFGVRAAWTTPDTMHDHVKESKGWECVGFKRTA